MHVQIDLPADEQKSRGSVLDLLQAAADSETDLSGLRQELAGELPLAFLGVDPGDDGQLMTPHFFDVIWVKADVGINPDSLGEAILNSRACDTVSGHIDL